MLCFVQEADRPANQATGEIWSYIKVFTLEFLKIHGGRSPLVNKADCGMVSFGQMDIMWVQSVLRSLRHGGSLSDIP